MRILAVILSIIVAATPLPVVHKDENTKETVTAHVKLDKPAEKPKPSIQKQTQTPPPKPSKKQKAPKKSNERIAWDFLRSKGYSKVQTAGIMGNLQQEHHFRTNDVAGGLGIAQWLGQRRANLMARNNYLSIKVQLNFLVDELNTVETTANRAVRASRTVEQATIAFSSLFERCGDCRNGQRIQYAYDILARY